MKLYGLRLHYKEDAEITFVLDLKKIRIPLKDSKEVSQKFRKLLGILRTITTENQRNKSEFIYSFTQCWLSFNLILGSQEGSHHIQETEAEAVVKARPGISENHGKDLRVQEH